MPDKTITNAAGLWGLTADANPDVRTFVNNSPGTLAPGDVVALATDTTGVLVTSTATVNDKTVVGVVAAKSPSDSLSTQAVGTTYAVGSQTQVIVRGPARINIGANTVSAGDLLTTGGSKVAATNAGAPAANAVTGSIIAVALEASAAKDANNTIRCYVNKL
jgi:hypothetical protein